jgi:predicted nucleotidyltransferase
MFTVGGISVSQEKLTSLCQQYQVKELCLFGSRARGDNRPDSDLDILVDFLPNSQLGLIGFAGMQRELAELFGHKVDLVPKLGLKPIIRDEVLPEAKSFYEAA